MLAEPIIFKIIEKYNLEKLLSTPKQMPGGRIHHLFYFSTTTGEYALKLLNRSVIRSQEDIDSLELTEKVAADLANHIHANVALTYEGGRRILAIDDLLIMIYPWLQGNVLSLTEVTTEQTEIIGSELAKIHQANVHLHGFIPPQWGKYSIQHWETLIHHTKSFNFYKDLLHLLPKLLHWSELATQALPVLNQHLIISHRDLDHNNVIWKNNNLPILIDWEFAGLINAGLDLLIVATSWGGRTENDPKQELFQSIIQGYQKIQKKLPAINKITLHGYIGYCLAWLEYTLMRAQQKNENHHIIEIEVYRSISALQWVNDNQTKLLDWLQVK